MSLPFKLNDYCIVIIKGLVILQCENCNEYLIEVEVMEKIDSILERIDTTVELEILCYAG